MSDRGGDDSDEDGSEKTPRAGYPQDGTEEPWLRERDEPSVGEASRARGAVLSALFPEESRVLDGRYELGSMIGSGGLGRVYKALDTKLGRHVAVKFLKGATRDPELALALEGEARVLARLQHPNIVAVHDVGRSEEELYLTMELIDGVSLETWLGKQRSWKEVVEVMRQAALGLSAAHEAGVVHRDFKPANVMIDRSGRVRVVDFGLAREVVWAEDSVPSGDDATLHTKAAGTPPYMAPEQFDGEVSAASDQFAFCTTLYEGLCGERPWKGRERGFGRRHAKTRRDAVDGSLRRAGVPLSVRRVVVRGVQRDARDRFGTMSELCSALTKPPTRKVSLAAAGALIGGAVGLAQLGAQDPCDVESPMTEVWSAATRTAIADRLGDGQSSAEIVGRLDEGSAKWTHESRRSCESHRNGETSALLHELRRACLERTVARFDYALGEVLKGETSASTIKATLVPAIDISMCGDDEALVMFGTTSQGEAVDLRIFDELERGIGRAYVQLNLGNEAEYFDGLEDLYHAHGVRNDAGQAGARIAFQYGTALSRREEFDEAERVMRDALLRHTADPRALVVSAELRSGLAVALSMDPHRAVEARNLAEDAIVVMRANGLSPTQIPAQVARARASALLGDETTALDALGVIDGLVERYDPAEPNGVTWNGYDRNRLELGVFGAELQARLGHREDASKRYLSVVEALREAGTYPRVLAQALNNAGELLGGQRQSGQGARFVEEAAAIKSTIGDRRGAAWSWMTAGTINLRDGRRGPAIAAYEQALAVLPSEHPEERFEILYNLGLVYQAERSFALARSTFLAARELSTRAGLEDSELRYNLEVASLQIEVSMQAQERAVAALSVVRGLERRSYSDYTRMEVEIAACEVHSRTQPSLARAAARRAEALGGGLTDEALNEGLVRCKKRLSEHG